MSPKRNRSYLLLVPFSGLLERLEGAVSLQAASITGVSDPVPDASEILLNEEAQRPVSPDEKGLHCPAVASVGPVSSFLTGSLPVLPLLKPSSHEPSSFAMYIVVCPSVFIKLFVGKQIKRQIQHRKEVIDGSE